MDTRAYPMICLFERKAASKSNEDGSIDRSVVEQACNESVQLFRDQYNFDLKTMTPTVPENTETSMLHTARKPWQWEEVTAKAFYIPKFYFHQKLSSTTDVISLDHPVHSEKVNTPGKDLSSLMQEPEMKTQPETTTVSPSSKQTLFSMWHPRIRRSSRPIINLSFATALFNESDALGEDIIIPGQSTDLVTESPKQAEGHVKETNSKLPTGCAMMNESTSTQHGSRNSIDGKSQVRPTKTFQMNLHQCFTPKVRNDEKALSREAKAL